MKYSKSFVLQKKPTESKRTNHLQLAYPTVAALAVPKQVPLKSLYALAPDIQEEVLALGYPAGREPIPQRTLQRLPESLVWEDQRALWAELRAGQARFS